MANPQISLVVIRTFDLEPVLDFYRALQLDFRAEQHGAGPLHYACEEGGVVFEIYPAREGKDSNTNLGGATMLGFRVASLDETLARLRGLEIEPQSAPKIAEWGRWVNVLDPDGRTVQLSEAPN